MFWSTGQLKMVTMTIMMMTKVNRENDKADNNCSNHILVTIVVSLIIIIIIVVILIITIITGPKNVCVYVPKISEVAGDA